MNPMPSLIVTAIRTIRSSLSSSSVPLIAELIKNSLESSWLRLISSFSTLFFPDMSLDIPLMPMTSPAASLIGDSVRLTSMIIPSFFFRSVSMSFRTSPFFIFSIFSFSLSSRKSGTKGMNLPIASASVKPKVFSAPSFQEVIMPSRSVVTIASAEWLMMLSRYSFVWMTSR